VAGWVGSSVAGWAGTYAAVAVPEAIVAAISIWFENAVTATSPISSGDGTQEVRLNPKARMPSLVDMRMEANYNFIVLRSAFMMRSRRCGHLCAGVK
jgi:hypothetical protein